MKDCIIIASGGLGNQMFEYAYMLGLKAMGYCPRLNLECYYIRREHNGWELSDIFGIDCPIIFHNTLYQYLTHWLLSPYCPQNAVLQMEQTSMIYDEKWLHPVRKFLKGVWIHPRYFAHVEEEVREAFQFKKIDAHNQLLAEEMNRENSVSIHIRRGDYLRLPRYHVCDESYYKRAIRIMVKQIQSPVFYVAVQVKCDF